MLESDRAAVLAYERHILATEGPYHVSGVYYANEFDADRQRRWAAGRMVREARRPEALESTAPFTNRPRVGTWLAPRERARVDVATRGQFELTHRETLHALRSDLTTGRIDAMLISAALIRLPDASTLSGIVRDFPGNLVVGFVAEVEEAQVLAGALVFGQAGVNALVDARVAAGWSAMRSAFAARRLQDTYMQRAVRDLTGADASEQTRCTAGWTRFLAAAFSPRMASAKQIAASLGVGSSTLTSRFYRAGLPSPKCYIAHARLVWVARLGETPGLSLAAIAHRLDASSPQSFGRTVRTLAGTTATEFRHRFDGATMLARFRTELVEPYRERLHTFNPLVSSLAERSPVSRARCTARVPLSGRAA